MVGLESEGSVVRQLSKPVVAASLLLKVTKGGGLKGGSLLRWLEAGSFGVASGEVLRLSGAGHHGIGLDVRRGKECLVGVTPC